MRQAFSACVQRSLTAAFLLVPAGLASGFQGQRSAARPNFVVFVTDDQDLGSMSVRRPGGELVMANVQRWLVEQGTSFRNCFVSTSLCSPSRASLLTGQYVHNHGVLTNEPPYGGYGNLDHTNTLPVWLRAVGYRTSHVGSYLNGYGGSVAPVLLPGTTEIPPGWDDWHTNFTPPWNFFGHAMNENGSIVQYSYLAHHYVTDVTAQKAVGLVHQHAASNQPFYLAVDFMAPHSPATPAPRHLGAMAGYFPPRTAAYDEDDVSDKPQLVRSRPKLHHAISLGMVRRRLESLLAVDEAVGAVMQALQETGQLENTFVLYLSDNGIQLGEHRLLAEKGFLYEESIRVPLVVRGPGVPRGAEQNEMVATIDLAPTICAWAGAPAGREPDGSPLQPLLAGHATEWRSHLLLNGTNYRDFVGILTQHHVYGEYDYDHDGTVEETELYAFDGDVCRPAGDPLQLDSRHALPCTSALRRSLSQRIALLRHCAGASCRAILAPTSGL